MTVLLLARAFGIGSRFLLTICAAAYLSDAEIAFYNFMLVAMQIATYAIGLELYQVVHRKYLWHTEDKDLTRAHMYYYIVLIFPIVVISVSLGAGFGASGLALAVIAAYSYSIFIEAYRYSGVLRSPRLGEVGYALRGLLAIVPIVYVVASENPLAISIILYCMVVDVLLGVIILASVGCKNFSFEITKKNITFLNLTLISIFRSDFRIILLLCLTAVSMRILAGYDKLLPYLTSAIQLSASYYFSSIVAMSIVGALESVFNNKYSPLVLSASITESAYFKILLKLFGVYLLIIFAIAYLFDSIVQFERFDFNLFALATFSAVCLSLGNGLHIIVYSRGHDKMNFLAVSIAMLFAAIFVASGLNYVSVDSNSVDLKVGLIFLSSCVALFLTRCVLAKWA